MMKNILVTGGSGFIGSNLADALVGKDKNVYVIDNLSTGLKENSNKKAHYLFEDITSYIKQKQSIETYLIDNKIDVVYHLAACSDVRLSINSPLLAYETNLLSSIAIFDACQKANVKKFIFASTSAVYGEPLYLPVDEKHPTNPISPYGLTKLAFEQYIGYKRGGKTEKIIFRLPNVYGPRQRPDLEGGVVAIFCDSMKNGKEIKFFGDGTQTRDWVHVDDIIHAFILCLDKYIGFAVISLGSGRQMSLQKLFDYMKKAFDYKRNPLFEPERRGDIKHMVMSGSEAHNMLSWKPGIDLANGVQALRKQGRICAV